MGTDTRPRILIYEDSKDLCELYEEYMKYALKDFKYSYTVVSTYDDFLPLIGQHFDIAIIDWSLDDYKGRRITASHILMAIEYKEAYLVSGYLGIKDDLSAYALYHKIPVISKGGNSNRGIEWMDFIKDAIEDYGK